MNLFMRQSHEYNSDTLIGIKSRPITDIVAVILLISDNKDTSYIYNDYSLNRFVINY